MQAIPDADQNLAALRPKGLLRLRMMFDGFWKWLTLMGVIFTAVGVAAAGVAGYFILLEVRYGREGRTATGQVTGKDTYATHSSSDSSGTSTTHYRVAYTFTAPDGSTHSGSGDTQYERWEPLAPGDPIEVQHLASDPATHRLLGERTGGLAWLFVIFPVAFGGAGVVLLVVAARSGGKKARLLANGTLTRGVVEAKEEHTNITINDRHPYDVTFTFALALADGEVHTAKTLVTDFKFAATLEPGTPIGAIYLPGDPDKATIFQDKWKKHFRATGS